LGLSLREQETHWRELRSLSARLGREVSLAGQLLVITRTVEQVLASQVLLWLDDSHGDLAPDLTASGLVLSPLTDLMQEALDSQGLAGSPQDQESVASSLAVPLATETGLVGLLQVHRRDGPPYSSSEEQQLLDLVEQVGPSLHWAELLESQHRQCQELMLVREVSAQVASTLDTEVLLAQIVELMRDRLGYPYVHLFTVDRVCDRVRYRAGGGERSRSALEQGLSYLIDDPAGVIPWVARQGETVLVNDIEADERYRPSALPPANTESELAVPLRFGDDVLGVLDVQSDRPNAFSARDQFILEALADNIAVALRNASLFSSEQWRRRVAESFREVAGLLAAGTGLEDTLNTILAELGRNLPSDAIAIWLLHDGDLCLSAAQGIPEGVCVADFSPESHPWLHQALNADQSTVRTPDSPYEPIGGILGFEADYSAIAAPLRTREQNLGLLTMVARSPGRYGPESRAMTSAFASYAAVAIENARLYESAQQEAYLSTVLLQVAEATQAQTSLDDVLETVVRLTPMVVGVDKCALLLWDPEKEAFLPAASYGLPPERLLEFDAWVTALKCELAFSLLEESRSPVAVRDVLPQLTDDTVSGAVCGFDWPWLVPLVAHGEMLGAMLVDHWPGVVDQQIKSEHTDPALEIVRGIAYQAAAAVANTRLMQQRQEEAYVSVALLQVAQVIVGSDDLNEILEAIVRITAVLAGVSRCALFLWNEADQRYRLTQSVGFRPDPTPAETASAGLASSYALAEFALLDSARERDELVIWDRDSADSIPSTLAALIGQDEEEASPSLIAAPLSVVGEVLGVMLVEEARGSPTLGDRRLELLEGIAGQAALAVQNDRLLRDRAERESFERDLQLAHELQHTLMPADPPDIPGWQLAAIWTPAREVGGDFYDFFELPDRRLGLVMADVADKGIPAALFMSLTRTLIRAAALIAGSPAEALDRVNSLLLPDSQAGMFVTAAYAVVSLGSSEVELASAGHNPCLLWRESLQHSEWLRVKGTVLGVVPELRLEQRSVLLDPGDYLVLYTDGVTEAFSALGEQYETERLQAAVQASAGRSAQDMLQTIVQSVREFVGEATPSDDLTIMVLKRVPG